jgi:hypothetical protein
MAAVTTAIASWRWQSRQCIVDTLSMMSVSMLVHCARNYSEVPSAAAAGGRPICNALQSQRQSRGGDGGFGGGAGAAA